ncbi:MAG: Dps family protein [Fimbriimonadaceae bacterium]
MSTVTQKEFPAPSALATPTTHSSEGAHRVTTALAQLTADAFALYIKTKNFHWHVSGPHFRDYHLMFDEQADQVFDMIDALAERARKVGGTTIRSVSHIASLQRIKDDNDAFVDPQEMLKRLAADNLEYARNLEEAHRVCGDAGDAATTSILENYIDETERRVWFLSMAAEQN